MVMVPDDGGEIFLRAFIGSTFALQFFSVVHILVEQCSVDVFFMDWERPRSSENPKSREEWRMRKKTQVLIYILSILHT